MVITVNDYGEIRRRYCAGESKRAIARRMGISRNTVEKYCAGENVPWTRKPYTPRCSPVINEQVLAFIKSCLEEDETENLPKQTHTAKKIYDRLVEERGFKGGESTVRRTVRMLNNKPEQAFIPLEFSPGEAMQIDWGEATIYLKGVKHIIQLFCARLCFSCTPIVFCFERQNQESFLEGLQKAIEYFEGVPKRVIFDNAKVAVKEGFGAHAVSQDRYKAFAAHYAFENVYCNPASGNEKGLVEGLVGWSRRNILVPLPHVDSLDELNHLLMKRCHNYLLHTIRGKDAAVGELLAIDRKSLAKLPLYTYDTAKSRVTMVDRYSTVRFDTNNYSVRVEYCGKKVSVKGYGSMVKVYYGGNEIAVHDRSYAKKSYVFKLQHYLPLLAKKPRSILNARPVRNTLPNEMLEWLGRQPVKEVISALQLCADYSAGAVWQNIRQGIPLQCMGLKPEPPKINDLVTVEPIDLAVYDSMLGGRMI